MRILAVLAILLSGCAYVGGQASPSPAVTATPTATTEPTGAPTLPPTAEPTAEPTATPQDRDAQRHLQAQAALQHWAAFMAGKPPDTIVFIYELYHGGGWHGRGADDKKTAFLNGLLNATVELPTESPGSGEVVWPDGSTQQVALISAAAAFDDMVAEIAGSGGGPCGACRPLEVVGATLTTRTALTSHGVATVPVWQFEFASRDAPMTPISYVAIRDRIGPQDWDAWADHAPPTDGAYGTRDDTEITIVFGGGACDASHSIEAVESDTAIVPIISSTARPGDCAAMRVGYALKVQLSAPLGDRAVLDLDNGWPVPVYPQEPPDGLRPG